MNLTKTPVVTIKGKALYTTSINERFIVRGVALSAKDVPALQIDDILSDTHIDFIKKTVIPQLLKLNVNMIRVYQANPKNSHSKVMEELSKNGIYVMLGLATSIYSIKRMNAEYTQSTFNHAAQLVDEFSNYENTLCFSVGNEVEFPGQQAANLHQDTPNQTDAEIVQMTINLELKVAQAMRSFARDVKHHISTNNYRTIPVGCAMQDGPQSSWTTTNPNDYEVGIIGTDIIAQYYASGDSTERMDYIGINTYRYLNGNPMSSYDGLAIEASPLPVPVILSETGGLSSTPRDWKIVPEMYTRTELYPQLSGQIAFQMLEEGAGFGLYSVSNNSGALTLTETTNGGASNLASVYATAASKPVHTIASTPSSPTSPPPSAGNAPAVKITWPSSLLPLKTYQAPNASITVKNYATYPIQLVQNDAVVGTIAAAASETRPRSGMMKVTPGVALSMQSKVKNNWDAVCYLPAHKVKAGITVRNDVSWHVNAVCPLGA
ncbi:hypothetical protein ACFPK9_07870 [Rubritalea spongiae]|uniref:Uncharacterized protein n=1 Tax=Rubritalea spongiae TaxID=430797 RepID=A0ABW5E074_9BACT